MRPAEEAAKAGLIIQSKPGVDKARAFVNTIFVYDYRDLDFRCRDHLDIDSGLAQKLEHLGRDARVRTHSDPDDAKFGDATYGFESFRSDLGHHWIKRSFDFGQLIRWHRAGDVGCVIR